LTRYHPPSSARREVGCRSSIDAASPTD
jgi:hypothetical protein